MNSAKDIFTCKVCNKYFNDPVFLPCGANICKEHVHLIKLENDENFCIFKCQICNNDHIVAKGGFGINQVILDLMKLNIHLDENTKQIHQAISSIDNVAKELNLICKDPANFVPDYFAPTKSKIISEREQMIKRAHEIAEEKLEAVKVLEVEAKANLRNVNGSLDRNQLELDKLEKLSKHWKEELRTPNLDEKRKNELVKETQRYLSEKQSKAYEYKNKILSVKNCFFVPKNFQLENEHFGELVFEKFSVTKPLKNPSFFFDQFQSAILTKYRAISLVNLCKFDSKTMFTLLYRASIDGFDGKDFHAKCDKISKTLTIIKAKDSGNIFGGYTEASWDCIGYKEDPKAFIFSLVNKNNQPLRIKTKDSTHSIGTYKDYLIWFGYGPDIIIYSNSNIKNDSNSNLGVTYVHPKYKQGSKEANSFLAGSHGFSTSEIEVYQVE